MLVGTTFLSPAATPKQLSLNHWRSLTAPGSKAPRVFVKGDEIRFYFLEGTNVAEFTANWSRLRVPTEGYRVHSALLKWNQRLSKVPEHVRGWREATVIAGTEWRQLSTNLVAELMPKTPGHGYYYQAFLADRLLYRDMQGEPRFAPLREQPKDVVIERRFSVDETLEVLSRAMEKHLAAQHPGSNLFLIMTPNGSRFTQPLLVDRQRRQSVWLTPAALYDPTERGVGLNATAETFQAMLFESHVIAPLKNPVSTAARLVDLGVETVVRFARLRLPDSTPIPPVAERVGMDLAKWEHWLDLNTGTRREDGSLELLIDGDRFFGRLQQAIASATNHIGVNVYIFDKDDVAVGIADQLKQRSADVNVRVILDRMGSLAGGATPPRTPLPEDFVAPASILTYLREDSLVHVHPFLNPWFSVDHTKVYLVDGNRAWLGGMNLGREYRYEWHDLMVQVEGPVVNSLEKEFRREWAHEGPWGDLAYAASLLGGADGPETDDKNKTPHPGRSPMRRGEGGPSTNALREWIKVRRLPTKTFWKPFSASVLGSLNKARGYIYAENPYIFDKRVLTGLVDARKRGVDVRVVMPRENDFKYGGRGNLVAANYLLEHGVRVYFYPGMTHVKALLVDGWSLVGSGNLSHISLRLSQEQNIATSDPVFAERLRKELFEDDFVHSYELTHTISVEWMDFVADMLLGNL
ncbi:MAG TPA: phosphatidylserine/phosphatidylglycerophosphate/cardiolipin synthase family protein [Candidatus Dormibacteraeota bacterium]|nr:phosphatidylserine/phosphatidylglycerophosphate/cardiolipin synthase family protein [Candidatus Dormibacteraeota bacterium]